VINLLTIFSSYLFVLCPHRSPHGSLSQGRFSSRKQSFIAHMAETFYLRLEALKGSIYTNACTFVSAALIFKVT
jgi:hypothetical protein